MPAYLTIGVGPSLEEASPLLASTDTAVVMAALRAVAGQAALRASGRAIPALLNEETKQIRRKRGDASRMTPAAP